jgi:hypothetical protein
MQNAIDPLSMEPHALLHVALPAHLAIHDGYERILKEGELLLQSLGRRRVIGIQSSDEAPPALRTPEFQRSDDPEPWPPKDADTRIAEPFSQLCALILAPVVDDDDLEVVLRLRQRGAKTRLQAGARISNGDQEGNSRLVPHQR